MSEDKSSKNERKRSGSPSPTATGVFINERKNESPIAMLPTIAPPEKETNVANQKDTYKDDMLCWNADDCSIHTEARSRPNINSWKFDSFTHDPNDSEKHLEQLNLIPPLITSVISNKKDGPPRFTIGESIFIQCQETFDVIPGRIKTPPTTATQQYTVTLENGTDIDIDQKDILLAKMKQKSTNSRSSASAFSRRRMRPRNDRQSYQIKQKSTIRVTEAAADPVVTATRRMALSACTMVQSTPIPILIQIFQYLDQPGLMKASTISKQWHWIIHTNPGMAQHRIIPVLAISASKNKSDAGRTVRLLEWLVANRNKLQRYRVLQLLDVHKFNGSFHWGPRFELDGIISFDVSSPSKLSSVNYRDLHLLLIRLPNLREINLSNIGGKDFSHVLGSVSFRDGPQLERITWNNIDTECNMRSGGCSIANKATTLREIMMDGSIFICGGSRDSSIDEISDLENRPRVFLFCRLKSQVLERISIRRAKFSTNSYVDGPQILTTVPQNALIKYIRNAPPSLRWFRSDLSKDNIEMLRLERPGIEFLN